jgi:hypothetical protein
VAWKSPNCAASNGSLVIVAMIIPPRELVLREAYARRMLQSESFVRQ